MTTQTRTHYSVNEAASEIGVDRYTIYRWLKTGYLKGVRVGPKLIRIPVNEVERMMVPFTELPQE